MKETTDRQAMHDELVRTYSRILLFMKQKAAFGADDKLAHETLDGVIWGELVCCSKCQDTVYTNESWGIWDEAVIEHLNGLVADFCLQLRELWKNKALPEVVIGFGKSIGLDVNYAKDMYAEAAR
jgi:hypothetical protein